MSFSKSVKHEISQNYLFECCQRSQLSALILLSSTLVINNDGISLQFATENSYIAKRVWNLIKDLYTVDLKLDVKVKDTFYRNNSYHVSIVGQGLEVLKDLHLYDEDEGLVEKIDRKYLAKDCCERAYLAGAFMASGSVNSPDTSNYHLEISTSSLVHSEMIMDLMNKLHLNAKIIQRRKSYVVYVKQAEKIGDFLRAIGASNAVMEFEETRIQRDFVNNFVRLDNCELANEVKILTAAQKQLESIEIIEKRDLLNKLSENHLEVIQLRKDFPESSLNELVSEYQIRYNKKISKSGLNHRFKKIEEIANNN